MVATHTCTHTTPKVRHITLEKRGGKYRIPPNKNRQEHKGKDPLEAQSYQKTTD